jgi:hypothetical protein
MKAPTKKIHIKTVEELQKKRWDLFGYEIHMPYKEFKKMSEELNRTLIAQMNCFETED